MSRRRKKKFPQNFSRKNTKNEIKNLASKITKVLSQNATQSLNYKQIASQLEITDADGRNQITKKIAELLLEKQIKETDRGKYQIVAENKYHIGRVY